MSLAVGAGCEWRWFRSPRCCRSSPGLTRPLVLPFPAVPWCAGLPLLRPHTLMCAHRARALCMQEVGWLWVSMGVSYCRKASSTGLFLCVSLHWCCILESKEPNPTLSPVTG